MAQLIWVPRLVVAAIMLLMLAYGARFTLGEKQTDGMLRLSWRILGERVRVCREYTEGERDRLRQHMQAQQSCTTSLLSYRLSVRIGGAPPVVRDIIPKGARSDRPLFVKEDFQLPPGEHDIEIQFLPLSGEGSASDIAERSSLETNALRSALEKAPRYVLERSISIEPGRIVLIDLDTEHGGFKVHGS